jgi:hypothetical protein
MLKVCRQKRKENPKFGQAWYVEESLMEEGGARPEEILTVGESE